MAPRKQRWDATFRTVCVCVLATQSCPTLYDPMDCSLPGSSVHGILQARILECLAISFSRGSSQPKDRTWVSCISGAHQALLSTRFSRQEYWSGLPFPSPGDLPSPGIKPGSPVLQADSLPSEPQRSPRGASKLIARICLFELWLSQSICLGMGLLACMVTLGLVLKEPPYCPPRWLV